MSKRNRRTPSSPASRVKPTRELTKAEHKRLGFSPGAQRRVAATVKRVTKSTPTISRREYLQSRAHEYAGVRLSLEKLAERRRTGEISYRTAAAAEQAVKQSETRRKAALIANALREPPAFTPHARRPRGLYRPGRRRRGADYNVPETPREIRTALNAKILHGRYIEDGTWHHVMDWAHAHGHDEVANLFRSTGRSTPISAGRDDGDDDYNDDE
jgi:hypothetical protein